MRLRSILGRAALCAAFAIPFVSLGAQVPADAAERLRAVLPPDVAGRVLERIAQARAQSLPAQALENRALKYASRGVAPAAIERAIAAHADRMLTAKDLLSRARAQDPGAGEVDAGAEALRQGVDGATVSALAKSAPSGRSLAVPLFVLGGLVDRGVPADSALARLRARLYARATDAELETLADGRGSTAGNARGIGNDGMTGLERAASMRPAGAGSAVGASGGATGVPQNGGKKVTPTDPRPPRPSRPDRP